MSKKRAILRKEEMVLTKAQVKRLGKIWDELNEEVGLDRRGLIALQPIIRAGVDRYLKIAFFTPAFSYELAEFFHKHDLTEVLPRGFQRKNL